MRKFPNILILLFAFSPVVLSQKSVARIENIRINMTDNYLEVKYDISGSTKGTVHQVDFAVVDNAGNIVTPDSISGDVGPYVIAGNDKQIVWKLNKEFDVIYGNFTPRLSIDVDNTRNHMRGPEYAFLSLLLPGLGDYFVADSKQLKFEPYYKTAVTAGFLGLSLAAHIKREEIPPLMNPPGWYYTMQSPDPVYIDHEWLLEIAKTDYWLFQYDAEILLGIGLATWLFDVIWVARRGVENNKIYNSVLEHVALVPVSNGLLFSCLIQF